MQSPPVAKILHGYWPLRNFTFCINGRTYGTLYDLIDGIYLRYDFLVGPHGDADTAETKEFNIVQEGTRKEVERLSGAIIQQFRVALHPAHHHTVVQRSNTNACVPNWCPATPQASHLVLWTHLRSPHCRA